MTNREWIESATDEQLAWVLLSGILRAPREIHYPPCTDGNKCKNYKNCVECITKWLKAEKDGLNPKFKVGDTVWNIGHVGMRSHVEKYGLKPYAPMPLVVKRIKFNKHSVGYDLKPIFTDNPRGYSTRWYCNEKDLYATKEECQQVIEELEKKYYADH